MWDAIVIGSGIGGLAAGAALAKRGHRVLVLEQHDQPGGQTQTFRRLQWVFATGVHYLAGVGPHPGPDGQFGRLLDWLADGALRFAPCTNPYDVVQWPGFEFGIAHPEAAYRDALLARFGHERAAIDRWFEACAQARHAAATLFAARSLPHWMATGLRWLRGAQLERWATRTVADELAGIRDLQLRGVLGARWGDYGPPPSRAPFIEHALVTGAYNAGAYYPIGGPARFAEVLGATVRNAGGELRVGAEVRRLLVRDGRVAGVAVEQAGERLEERAPAVISAIGVGNTVARLDEPVAAHWRDTVRTLAPGVGFLALYIGLEGDIAAAGADSANRWIYAGEDVDRLWRDPADEDAPNLFVSFPSLKDPSASGPPTAEVLAVADPAVFARWLGRPDAARDEDYLAWKDWVGQRLRAQFERRLPALAPMVCFHELATPLTQRRYTRTPDGAMYGLEMTGARLTNPALDVRTPLPGLLLAGQDVFGPGVPAAFMSGMVAAAAIEPALWSELRR
jgi:all-trans-retinol 13,14-reductase